MGKEQPSSYYDKVYAKSAEYSKDWKNSRYLKVWERMVQRFDKEDVILDLGCGVGQTAQFIYNQGFKRYFGIDFSKQAIELSQKCGNGSKGFWTNGYRFVNTTIEEYLSRFKQGCMENTAPHQFFLSEVLEHIENDEAILAVLSQKFTGSRISLSVPTFDDTSHVRHFKSTNSVKERYSPFIQIEDLSQIGPWIIVQGKLK